MNVKRIVKEIKNNNLVITPTDTVYGILAKSSNDCVINKVYEIKKRSHSKSLILLINGLEMLDNVAKNVTLLHKQLMDRYWPGKLTIIFDKKENISNIITGGGDTVAVRYPNNNELIRIITKLKEPLISTSANISNKETITNINMLDEELLKSISYVSDGGDIKASSSTIVKIMDNKIIILRDGELGQDIRNHFNVM